MCTKEAKVFVRDVGETAYRTYADGSRGTKAGGVGKSQQLHRHSPPPVSAASAPRKLARVLQTARQQTMHAVGLVPKQGVHLAEVLPELSNALAVGCQVPGTFRQSPGGGHS